MEGEKEIGAEKQEERVGLEEERFLTEWWTNIMKNNKKTVENKIAS